MSNYGLSGCCGPKRRRNPVKETVIKTLLLHSSYLGYYDIKQVKTGVGYRPHPSRHLLLQKVASLESQISQTVLISSQSNLVINILPEHFANSHLL